MFVDIIIIICFVLLLVAGVGFCVLQSKWSNKVWSVIVDGRAYGPVTALDFEKERNEVSFVHHSGAAPESQGKGRKKKRSRQASARKIKMSPGLNHPGRCQYANMLGGCKQFLVCLLLFLWEQQVSQLKEKIQNPQIIGVKPIFWGMVSLHICEDKEWLIRKRIILASGAEQCPSKTINVHICMLIRLKNDT